MTSRPRSLDHSRSTLDDFYTSDSVMETCLARARVAAGIDLPVLILGESGAGKTMLARAIHNSSARKSGPFASFNAAALSETLLDSQLFGHERGAFTGAQDRVKGKFELADNGTLFLDEVADLTAAAQAKILRAVETGEFERLGSDTLRQADVRVISATHHRIDPGGVPGRFREDLFFRLSGLTIVVPPLRERPQDLPALLAAEVARASEQQEKAIVGLDRAAAERLLAYRWPGNLRELSSVIRAAVAMASTDVIGEELLVLLDEPERSPRTAVKDSSSTGSLLLRDAVQRHITAVLEQVGGSKRRAARELGVSRATLDRKLRGKRVRQGGRPQNET
jgi:transcriptional regulator with PAS, ATPase and Fis domain